MPFVSLRAFQETSLGNRAEKDNESSYLSERKSHGALTAGIEFGADTVRHAHR